MEEAYGVKIAGVLVMVCGDGEAEAINRAIDMYHQLHPDTDKNHLATIARAKLLVELKAPLLNNP